ncbi:unnamed protein product [Linum trigynum]|uniref:NADH dehydrogenase subunit 2 n=1 Tax=Linum trigynum TaxID=586398 RepID=A0AAV2ENZ3_9ROSI
MMTLMALMNPTMMMNLLKNLLKTLMMNLKSQNPDPKLKYIGLAVMTRTTMTLMTPTLALRLYQPYLLISGMPMDMSN